MLSAIRRCLPILLLVLSAAEGRAEMSGLGTPKIDGKIGPGEWATSATRQFAISTPTGSAQGTLYVMNDAANLYLAFSVPRPAADPGTNYFRVFLDANGDGIESSGDDVISADAPPFGPFLDTFMAPCGNQPSTCYGGRETEEGAGAFANDGGRSTFELAHPLNTGDPAHDVALHIGDTIKFSFWTAIGGAYSEFRGPYHSASHAFEYFDIIRVAKPCAACGTGQSCCSGLCVDLLTSRENCGQCGNNCGSSLTCVDGHCANPECPQEGQLRCGTQCIDPMIDPNNCGGCDNKCGANRSCCHGSCVDLQTASDNCGSCGKACSAGEHCAGGTCRCKPRKCGKFQCGEIDDGCGKTVHCGCPDDYSCCATKNTCFKDCAVQCADADPSFDCECFCRNRQCADCGVGCPLRHCED